MIKALRTCGVYEDILAMPDQMETVLGERGVSLSGGQKQRAVIARMFASDPDIFILDEPTTGMDAGTKDEFYELMHTVPTIMARLF